MRGPIQLLKDSWTLFSNHAWLFISIYLVPTVLTFVYAFFMGAAFAVSMPSPMSVATIVFAILLTLILIAMSVISGVAMIKAVSAPEETTLKSAYKFGLEHLWSYLWLSVLVGLAVLGGFILFIIPGIIFMVWFAFAYFALVIEGKRGAAAMKASREYVRGRFWPVLGRIFALGLVLLVTSLVVNTLIEIAFSMTRENAEMVGGIINIVLVPFSIAYMYALYTDVRSSAPRTLEAAAAEAGASTGDRTQSV